MYRIYVLLFSFLLKFYGHSLKQVYYYVCIINKVLRLLCRKHLMTLSICVLFCLSTFLTNPPVIPLEIWVLTSAKHTCRWWYIVLDFEGVFFQSPTKWKMFIVQLAAQGTDVMVMEICTLAITVLACSPIRLADVFLEPKVGEKETPHHHPLV